MPEGEGVLLNTAGWKLWHKLRAAVLRNAALNANDEKTFKFDSPEAVIPYCGLTGNGQAPMLYTQWAVSGGIVRFAGEEAKVKLPAARPVPRPTGHEKVSVSYRETPGDLGEWRAICRDLRLQNDLND